MNCPNCGAPYEEQDTFCTHCNTALGNASYTSVEKAGKGVIRFFLILFLLAILSISAIFGYRYFQKYARQECTKDATLLMEAARDGLLETYPNSIPENLKNYTFLSQWVDGKVQQTFEEQDLIEALEYYGIATDSEAIANQICQQASFEISKTNVHEMQCDITVTVNNYNYPQMLASLKEELPHKQDSHPEEENHNWWDGFSDWLHSWTKSNLPEDNFPKNISNWIIQLSENSQSQKTEGQLHYKWIQGKWTLISADSSLFDALYGFPQTP